jgi:uncharacterized protein
MATVLFACQQNGTQHAENQISIGVSDSVFSNILNEQRQIWVYVPGGATHPAAKKYPVVYLLDGNAHFHSVTGMIHQLSTINTVCPDMIVVGIPNTDRTRDLTPTHVAEVFGDTTWSKTSGGAENFTRFIQEELIPYIDAKYPATTHRTLIGHSFGGLFAVNTLVHHPDLFNNYIAIDPSLWWDDQKLSQQAAEALSASRYQGKSLFVSVANTMAKGMDIAMVHSDTTEDTAHIRSILKFNQQTETTASGLNFEWKYYPEDSHGSVPLISEYDALRYLFSWYELKDVDEFFFPDSKLTVQDLTDRISNHYKTISEHFGYPVMPDEGLVNGMGYGFLQNNKPEHAFAMFKMNVDNYPQSANVYDSMGDCYLAQQDTANAIENFSKAVSIGNLTYSKDKLDKLKAKK